MNTIITSITITIVLCLSFTSSFSQSKFVKGYYISEQNDTISAYINDRNWDKNPKAIQVKNTPEDKNSHILKVSDIKSFSIIEGDVFVREIVDIDKSSYNTEFMQQGEKPVVVTDTVFLRLLVKGAINLYFLKDENAKEHFYIQKQNMQPQELLLRKFKQEVDNKSVLAVSPIYKGLLTHYLSDCASIQSKISQVDFKSTAFKEIIKQYNACQGYIEKTYVSKKEEKINYKLGALMGISMVSLRFKGEGHEDLINTNFKSPASYTLGLSLNILLPRQHQRWSIYNEILYKPYSAVGHYENIKSAENYSKTDFQFKFNYLGLGNMIRYQLSAQKVRPFINIGLANNIILKSTNTREQVSKFYSDESSKKSLGLADLRHYEQALLIGAGINNQKISTEIRLEMGNGISEAVRLASRKNMLSFMLGYNFN